MRSSPDGPRLPESPGPHCQIHETVWMAPGVQVYGRVSLEERVSLWPGAVIRAECQHVRVGRMTNLQDGVVVHVGYDHPTEIGEFCSVAHRAVVHGARVGDHCLIGIAATLMDGAVIGRGSIVGSGAVVPPGREFPPFAIVAGVPAKQIGERDSARENRLNAWLYQRNAEHYRKGLERAWDGPEYEAWLEAKRAEIDADLDLR